MKVEKRFLNKNASNRPGTRISPKYITIHETANKSIGANAEMHARYLNNDDAKNRQVSWHLTIDDSQAIQHLPLNELGWHAGGQGNRNSIGVEICVNADGDFNKAKNNAAKVVSNLLEEMSLPRDAVVTHKFWTGKECPANLLNDWENFLESISHEKEIKTNDKPINYMGLITVTAESLWVYNKPDWNARYKTVQKGEVFTVIRELTVNRSIMYELLSGLYITANKKFVTLS